jgi:hypothetical protein
MPQAGEKLSSLGPAGQTKQDAGYGLLRIYLTQSSQDTLTVMAPLGRVGHKRYERASASPDKWVVDGYPLRYETTYLRASFD